MNNPEKLKEKSGKLKGAIFYSILAIICITSAIYIYWCVQIAPWGHSDSAVYFSSAKNLASGKGLGVYNPNGEFNRLDLHAPFFPIFLSVFALFKIDLILINQIFDGLLWALFVFVCGFLFYRLSKAGPIAIFIALIISCSLPLIKNFTGMMSEPLAFTSGIVGFLTLILFLKEKNIFNFYTSAIFCSISFATRYGFIFITLTAIILIFLFLEGKLKSKIILGGIFAAISTGPMALWSLSSYFYKSSVGGRQFIITESLLQRFLSSLKNIYEITKYWLPFKANMLPGINPEIIKIIFLLFILFLVSYSIIYSIKNKSSTKFDKYSFILIIGSLIMAITYFVVFEFSYLFLTGANLDERLISPLLPPFFFMLMGSILIIGKSINRKYILTILGLLITVIFFTYNFSLLEKYSRLFRSKPQGYADIIWRRDQIFFEVNKISEKTKLISNFPDILLFYSNRNAFYLSRKDFQDERYNELINDCSIIVLFNPAEASYYENREDPIREIEYSQIISLYRIVFTSQEGVILQSKNCLQGDIN